MNHVMIGNMKQLNKIRVELLTVCMILHVCVRVHVAVLVRPHIEMWAICTVVWVEWYNIFNEILVILMSGLITRRFVLQGSAVSIDH